MKCCSSRNVKILKRIRHFKIKIRWYKRKMDDILDCPICSAIMEEPRMLRCQHTYCHSCLVNIIKDSNKLCCPQCREETTLAEEDEILSSDEKIRKIPFNRTVKKFLDRKAEFCIKHGGKEFIYFCSRHKRLSCGECLVTDCKQCHKDNTIQLVEVYAESPKFIKDFSQQKDNLRRMEEMINQTIKRFKDNMDEIKTEKLTIEQRVETFEEGAIKIVNGFKSGLLKELERKYSDEKTDIENHITQCDRLKVETSELVYNLNEARGQSAVIKISKYLSTEDKLKTVPQKIDAVRKIPQTVISKDVNSILSNMKDLMKVDVKVTKFAWHPH